MTTDLTKITGIGANSAANLNKAGFETIEAIASSTVVELSKVSGFGPGRAERVIATAKEMTEAAEFTEIPEVTEQVTATDEAPKKATESKTKAVVASIIAMFSAFRLMLGTAAAIVILFVAGVYFDVISGFNTFNPFGTTEQEVATSTDASESAPVIAANGQQQISQSVAAQRAQAQSRQQVQMQKHQSMVQKHNAQSEQFRARAEQQREASFNRYLASLPPAQAQLIVQQREFAMKQMADAKAKHAAFVAQHKARVNARYGNRFGS